MSNAQLKRCVQYKIERNVTGNDSQDGTSGNTIQSNFIKLSNALKQLIQDNNSKLESIKDLTTKYQTLDSFINGFSEEMKKSLGEVSTKIKELEDTIVAMNDVLEDHKKAIDSLQVNAVEL